MNYSQAADYIIVYGAVGVFINFVAAPIVTEIILSFQKWNKRRVRKAKYDKWLAARIAAREKCEAEGGNMFEQGKAMDKAGEAIWPGGPWR